MVIKVVTSSVQDGEGESFQPCRARFRCGVEYYVIFASFKVFTTCQYPGEKLQMYPEPLVLSGVKCLPPFLYDGERLLLLRHNIGGAHCEDDGSGVTT